jgi:hypothetical protein
MARRRARARLGDPEGRINPRRSGKAPLMPENEVQVKDVKAFRTKSGNTRFVLVDDQGTEYSTFREQIAAKLQGLEGRRARIKYHEQERDGFTNVYLDAVEPLGEASTEEEGAAAVDEVAWKTTMEAAPYRLRRGRGGALTGRALRQAPAVQGARRGGHRRRPRDGKPVTTRCAASAGGNCRSTRTRR